MPRYDGTPIDVKIADALRRRRRCSLDDLVAATGLPTRTIRDAVDRLEYRGIVDTVRINGETLYTLA